MTTAGCHGRIFIGSDVDSEQGTIQSRDNHNNEGRWYNKSYKITYKEICKKTCERDLKEAGHVSLKKASSGSILLELEFRRRFKTS